MTFASALFGGSDPRYISGRVYPASEVPPVTTASTPNKDVIFSFSPRQTLTVDAVAWQRDTTTAANVYVGIYAADGTLLTDCAVDSDTTAGTHAVGTTPITLVKDALYYFCWNASADCGTLRGFASGDSSGSFDHIAQYGLDGSLASDINILGTLAYSKSRTNAALLSSLTMSGFSSEIVQPAMGFRVA